jgi:hypothetical protein
MWEWGQENYMWTDCLLCSTSNQEEGYDRNVRDNQDKWS